MREIKFRAWEKHHKEMIPVEDINFVTKVINLFNGVWRFFSEIILMQYIEFKDINDKEIYEGDIVTGCNYPFKDIDSNMKPTDKPCYNGIVRWDNFYSCFYVELYCVADDRSGISNGMSKDFDEIDSIEVVGNIYENPEMLKGYIVDEENE